MNSDQPSTGPVESVVMRRSALARCVAKCGTCQHFRHETDGDYGEIDCGTFCTLRDPNCEAKGDLSDESCCDLWYPEFWQSTYATRITGPSFEDVDKQMKAAVTEFHRDISTA